MCREKAVMKPTGVEMNAFYIYYFENILYNLRDKAEFFFLVKRRY